jgi:hypothetical protein
MSLLDLFSEAPPTDRGDKPRRKREISLPEIVESTHVVGKHEAADDTVRVVDHCLLKIAAVEKELVACLRKHEAVVVSGGGGTSRQPQEPQQAGESHQPPSPASTSILERCTNAAMGTDVEVIDGVIEEGSDEGSAADAQEKPDETPAPPLAPMSSTPGEADQAPGEDGSSTVPKKFIKKFLKKELEEAGACMALPIVFLMFTAFCLGTIGDTSHFKTEQLHSLDHAVSFDIEENANFAFVGSLPFENGRMGWKNIYDVNSIADFWSWLNLGLLPIFFPSPGSWDTSESRANVAAQCVSFKSSLQGASWPKAVLDGTKTTANIHGSILQPGGTTCPEGLDAPERPKDYYGDEQVPAYLFHQQSVGGMRMRQEYTAGQACSDSTEKFRGRLFSGICLDFGPYKLMPEVSGLLRSDEGFTDHPNGGTVYFPTRTPLVTMLNITRTLENDVWFSPYTRKIDLLYTTYNPTYNSVTATNIFFVVNRAGHIFKIVEPITFVLDAYPEWYSYLFDIVWLLCVIKLGAGEIMDAAEYWDEFGPIGGTLRYLKPSNLIDWLNVLYALVIVIFWMMQLSSVSALQGMLTAADPTRAGSFSTNAAMVSYFDQIDVICKSYTNFRKLLAFYPFVIISGFLKPYNAQPRLGIMTRTLSAAAVDIIHFFFVFAIVFCIYSIMGMMLFGQELVEFATFSRALTATFHTLLGDIPGQETSPDDEYPLARAGRLEAALWVWSFCWIINLTMLNMLLAIVMDTYAAVRSDMPEDAETLVSQAVEIASRSWYQFKYGYLPLDKILEAMDPTALDDGPDSDDDEEFDAKKLILEVDERQDLTLPIGQANALIDNSVGMQRDADNKGGGTQSEMVAGVQTMDKDIKALLQIVQANRQMMNSALDPYPETTEAELLAPPGRDSALSGRVSELTV